MHRLVLITKKEDLEEEQGAGAWRYLSFVGEEGREDRLVVLKCHEGNEALVLLFSIENRVWMLGEHHSCTPCCLFQ
jgi:hypothetical protein